MSNYRMNIAQVSLWKKLWNMCITFCIFVSKLENTSLMSSGITENLEHFNIKCRKRKIDAAFLPPNTTKTGLTQW